MTVSGIQAHRAKKVGRAVAVEHLPVFVDDSPIAMFSGHLMIEANVQVGGYANIHLAARFHDLPEHIKMQVRMHRAKCRRIVGEADIAFGKNVHVFDVRFLERVSEHLRIEIGAEVGNIRQVVEIDMNSSFDFSHVIGSYLRM